MIQTDHLILGTGIAGLRAALGLAGHGRVLVLTKDQVSESNSTYAQGGVAVALGEDDDPALHLADTLSAGAGIVSRPAARVLVEEGPERIRELIAWGIRFDREAGRMHFTREAAHSRRRILHAHGDAIGGEITRGLLSRVQGTAGIDVRPFCCATDLIAREGRIVGCRFLEHAENAEKIVLARTTLLATGGAGHVFAETTNPTVATGDGIAMALRAGAALVDLEFVQFHPTALALPGEPRFLVSEAVRGEGAYLRNAAGERFTDELAPRDQVARAIFRENLAGRGPVFLDLRHLDRKRVRVRFPHILATCLSRGVDITHALVPVTPVAHYLMGGVATDLHGRTSLPGLWAAGETACTGVHGANRLASNSLLEGLVFGARAAEAMIAEMAGEPRAMPFMQPAATAAGVVIDVESVRREAWEKVGLERHALGLRSVIERLTPIRDRPESAPTDRAAAEARNVADVTWAMAVCALFREESRGAHAR
ncbi:MAG: L-aspartate oxidase, partial [Vicinamibacteria bacterium]|nr:L-aspartate oxidase [Vicinamibacteria bacterium]